MKKAFLLSIILAFGLVSCEEEDIETANRVSFENDTVLIQVPRDAVDFERPVAVYTTTISSVDRQFQVIINEDETTLNSDEYSLPSSVTVPANSNKGELILTVSDISLSFEPQTLALELVSDEIFTGNAILNVTERCDDTITALNLVFDDWAEEAYWEIYDLSGTPVIIFSGGQGGVYTDLDNSEFNAEFCLESGDYGIVVYDTYGDGGTVYTVSVGETVLTSATVPGGSPGTAPTSSSAVFNIE
ncbi:hypothetical protein [Winogradskyella forsetii]|uniref:hypothetical protein n=1 Tax=Winogradskyella forsetii TaxID=2686077 RepID=UPI0015BBA329|nr:hypothetical protein [Winogradskyella forsetii]